MYQLVLKLPPNKPPFIGIYFEVWGLFPPSLNTDLIMEERYKGSKYQLFMEFENYGLRLKLINFEKLIIRDYTGIVLDIKYFKEWIATARKVPLVNFGHVTRVNHEDAIIRTYPDKKPIVFKITEVRLLNSIPV